MEQPTEFERLTSELLAYASVSLRESGEMWPIGAGVTPSGELQWCAIDDDGDGEVSAVDEIALLVDGLRRDAVAGRFTAAGTACPALVCPPGIAQKVNAVELRLDDSRGDSLRVYVPYLLSEEGELALQTPFVFEGDRSLFQPRELIQLKSPDEYKRKI